MGELVPASQVAEAIDIGPRAVRLKAVKNNWATVRKPKQGGSEMYFIRDLLPLEVQQNLVDRQAVVGNPEAHAYETPVPPRAKRIGLAKYNLVHAFRIAKAKAPWGEKTQAMDNFLLAYNTGLLLPQIFETVGSLSVTTLESLNRKLKAAQDDYLVLCDGRGGWKKHGTNHYRGRQLSEAAKAVFLRCYLTPNTPSVTMAVRATKMILKEQDIPD
ncbi:MAG: hypothetical protein MI749_14175, partial [Desulfovibrionales bacterium]|nr:hypothetical protein [Desulfovibrionales bacterium]